MVEPGGDTLNLDGLDVETVTADLRDADAVARAAAGCRYVFHVAALYRFWAADPERLLRHQRERDPQRAGRGPGLGL